MDQPIIDQNQAMAVSRNLVSAACGFFIGHGWINQQESVALIAAAPFLASVVWSFYASSYKRMATKVAANEQTSHLVVNSVALADAIPSTKVTAAP